MRTFLRILLVGMFLILSPLFLLLLATNSSGLSAQSIKQQFVEENVYEKFDREFDKFIDQSLEEEAPDDPVSVIGPWLKQEITPAYVREKEEAFIDDTDLWLRGKTSRPPTISFKEVKEHMMQSNPALIQGLVEISQELKKQKLQDLNAPDLPDFEKLIESDFSYPIGEHMGWVKTWYTLATTGVFVLGFVLILLFVGIAFLSPTKTSRLRWIVATLFGSTLWNLVPWLIAVGASFLITKALIQNASKLPSFLFPMSDVLIKPLLSTYTLVGGIAIGVFLTASVASFLAAYSSKTKMTPQPKIISKRSLKRR